MTSAETASFTAELSVIADAVHVTSRLAQCLDGQDRHLLEQITMHLRGALDAQITAQTAEIEIVP